MSITTTTHLNFGGGARTALAFYASVFGGQTTIASYADFGMQKDAPGAELVVFGQLESADGFRIMAYDSPGATGGSLIGGGATRREQGTTVTEQSCFVSVRGETLTEVEAFWAKLTEGGTVVEELAASAWSPGFGMVTDRFGVTWILDVATAD